MLRNGPVLIFRGCGFVSLENLLFFARRYPVLHFKQNEVDILNYLCAEKSGIRLLHTDVLYAVAAYLVHMQASFQKLLLKTQGMRATWEYPFATAGVNVSHMLIQLLELNSGMHPTGLKIFQCTWQIRFACIYICMKI